MQIKEWILYLKQFSPKVLSLGSEIGKIKKVAYYLNIAKMKPGYIYIGRISDIQYQFHLMESKVFFLQKDIKVDTDITAYGSNCVVLFPETVSLEELYEKCLEYLEVQEEVSEHTQTLIEAYLSDNSIVEMVAQLARIIGNPVMLIDSSYRMISYSKEIQCEDIQWNECIENGYCSYEFISQFNQLSEIRSSSKEAIPFFAGCMMSPIRRCIAKIFVEQQHVGYLLSIEANQPFGEATIQIIEVAAKLFAKEMDIVSMKTGKDIYYSKWDILNFAIEGRAGSHKALKNYMKEAKLRLSSQYYIFQVGQKEYAIENHSINHISQSFQSLFPRCVASYYESNMIILVDTEDDIETVREKLWKKKSFLIAGKLHVTVSDPFTRLDYLPRYYQQTVRTCQLMNQLQMDSSVCFYNDIRRYDMIIYGMEENLLKDDDVKELPLFISEKEMNIYRYDMEHKTEFFSTIYSYIKNSKSVSKTANDIHVHKNTVTYRIGRVKELFGLDLNDAEIRIGLYMAYKTLEVLGVLA